MSDRAIAIHGIKMSGERRANLEKKSECPGLMFAQSRIDSLYLTLILKDLSYTNNFEIYAHLFLNLQIGRNRISVHKQLLDFKIGRNIIAGSSAQ